jgi:hypothetical protein
MVMTGNRAHICLQGPRIANVLLTDFWLTRAIVSSEFDDFGVPLKIEVEKDTSFNDKMKPKGACQF